MRFLPIAFALVAAIPLHGSVVTFASGATHVQLIELFTSEGCSSCPPAEQWLSERVSDAGLWRTFVPVSWHVDYWNRLGWPDRFSSREFTQRQYDYVTAWHGDSVYTPCFVRDGTEWRSRSAQALVARGEPVGVLTVQYDGRSARGEFRPGISSGTVPLELHVVLLGGGIASKVTAGENGGRTLQHDFVALALASGELRSNLVVPRKSFPGVTRYAIAAWITRKGDVVPIQAIGGWLD